MTTALVVLSAIMAIVVGWLVRRTLNVSPWQAQTTREIAQGNGELSMPSVQVGLVVFMTVATSLFALLISAYYMRMVETDWTNFALPRVLWLNTGVLVGASVAMQMTRSAARRGSLDGIRKGLLASGAFSIAFLGGQIWAWQQLNATGEFTPANPAYAFFILLTAVHGLHLLGRHVGLGTDDVPRAARRRPRQSPALRRALHAVLALPAPGLGSALRRAAQHPSIAWINSNDATRTCEHSTSRSR